MIASRYNADTLRTAPPVAALAQPVASCAQELYGGAVAGALTSGLSRMLTLHVQRRGFTCGMRDLLLTAQHEALREENLAAAEAAAVSASAAVAGVNLPPLPASAPISALRAAEHAVRHALRPMYRQSALVATVLDQRVSSALNPVASSVTRVCFPQGLRMPFLQNNMSLMTATGAKGGLVNFSQISAMLGQQDLEGRRVPRMSSGKTLPCFHAFDAGARSGGFIGDRFLSGVHASHVLHRHACCVHTCHPCTASACAPAAMSYPRMQPCCRLRTV
jgi:DNA-directed RNA polymerase I subunit RPA1